MSSTQVERILTKLREPGWHPGPSFGNDYRELSARISELNAKGWNIVSRKQRGKRTHEYRIGSIA